MGDEKAPLFDYCRGTSFALTGVLGVLSLFAVLCFTQSGVEERCTFNLATFLEFCKREFHLLEMAYGCHETRKAPQIPMRQLFLFVVLSLCLRKKSFHQMDQWARLDVAKHLLGSRRRMVLSDATLWRVLPTVDTTQARRFLRKAFQSWKQRGPWTLTLPSGRSLRVGIVDGSQFGRFYASCLQIRADRGDFFLDLEVAQGKGKEKSATRGVLERGIQALGRSFVDLLLTDGLYVDQKFFRDCRKKGLHALVKCKQDEQERLLILRDARGILETPSMADLVQRVQGIDLDRGVTYVVEAAGGFQHEGYPGTLKVARVTEEHLKPIPRRPAREVFWVITTDESLGAEDLRVLAHERWSVENRGFKMLNDHMKSKHVWTRGKNSPKTFEVLMLWMFLAFALVKTFESSLSKEVLWEKLRLRKLTLEFLVRGWELSLGHAPPVLEETG